MRLQLLTPPAVEPIALADAKQHLRVISTDQDAIISRLIVAARRWCEAKLKQSLVTQTWKLYLDSFPSAGGYYNRAIREVWPSLGGMPSGLGFYPGLIPNSTGVIDLPNGPIQSITSVQYVDFEGVLQTYDPSNYVSSLGFPGKLQPQYSHVWPISRPTIDSVQIAYVTGYGDAAASVPENIQAAILLIVGNWYERREWTSDTQYLSVPHTVEDLLAASDHGAYY